MNTDPFADFLTRIRNGIAAKHRIVEIPKQARNIFHCFLFAGSKPINMFLIFANDVAKKANIKFILSPRSLFHFLDCFPVRVD